MSVMRNIVLHLYTKCEVRSPSRSEVGRFWVTALIGLVTLTFRPLNEVTSHPCIGLTFLSIFDLLLSSVLDLGSDTGQTDVQADRQTDRQTSGQTAAISAYAATLKGRPGS